MRLQGKRRNFKKAPARRKRSLLEASSCPARSSPCRRFGRSEYPPGQFFGLSFSKSKRIIPEQNQTSCGLAIGRRPVAAVGPSVSPYRGAKTQRALNALMLLIVSPAKLRRHSPSPPFPLRPWKFQRPSPPGAGKTSRDRDASDLGRYGTSPATMGPRNVAASDTDWNRPLKCCPTKRSDRNPTQHNVSIR